jgi:hypothetical protein
MMKLPASPMFCSIGLVPIPPGYGAMPSVSLDALSGIAVDSKNLTHIMRAVIGLCFGMVMLWLRGAFSRPISESRYIMKPYDGQAATVGNGVMAGISADSPDTVDRIHRTALELGGTDEGSPGNVRGPGS